jgi:hypothetical protein
MLNRIKTAIEQYISGFDGITGLDVLLIFIAIFVACMVADYFDNLIKKRGK